MERVKESERYLFAILTNEIKEEQNIQEDEYMSLWVIEQLWKESKTPIDYVKKLRLYISNVVREKVDL